MTEKNYATFDIILKSNELCHPRKYDRDRYTSMSKPTPKPKLSPDDVIYAHNEEVPNLYYIDIKKMNSKQLEYFKKYAKFEKMTPGDYVNWLILNKDNLNEYNRDMLYNHTLGYKIIAEDIPLKIGSDKIRIDNEDLDTFRIAPTRIRN